MADPVIVSRRRADANAKFQAEGDKLASRLGIGPPSRVPPEINRDPELKKVVELENVVAFLASVNEAFDRKQAPKVKDPLPATPAPQPQAAKAVPAQAPIVGATQAKK